MGALNNLFGIDFSGLLHPQVTEMVDQEAGYLQRDGLLLACEILDCQPWFDFADLEVMVPDSEAESMSTDPDELLDSDDSDILTAEEEDTFRLPKLILSQCYRDCTLRLQF